MSNKKRRYDLPPIMINEISDAVLKTVVKEFCDNRAAFWPLLDPTEDVILKTVEGVRQNAVQGFLYRLMLSEAQGFLAAPPDVWYDAAEEVLHYNRKIELPKENTDNFLLLAAIYKLPDSRFGDVQRAYNELKDLLTRHPELMPKESYKRREKPREGKTRLPSMAMPDNAMRLITKISQQLPAITKAGAEKNLREIRQEIDTGQTKELLLLTRAAPSYKLKNGDIVQIPFAISPDEMLIYDAVCTLYGRGEKTFTAKQVYQIINGYDSDVKIDRETLLPIEQYLLRLAYRPFALTTNADKQKYKDLAPTYGGSGKTLLHLDFVFWSIKELIQFTITEPPVLYEYASAKGQIAQIPTRLINMAAIRGTTTDKKGVTRVRRTSPQLTSITNEIVRRISIMIYDAEHKDEKGNRKGATRTTDDIDTHIRFDTVFEACDIEYDYNAHKASKKDYDRIRQAVHTYIHFIEYELLPHLVRENFIAAGNVYYAAGSRAPIGIEIKLL